MNFINTEDVAVQNDIPQRLAHNELACRLTLVEDDRHHLNTFRLKQEPTVSRPHADVNLNHLPRPCMATFAQRPNSLGFVARPQGSFKLGLEVIGNH